MVERRSIGEMGRQRGEVELALFRRRSTMSLVLDINQITVERMDAWNH